MRDERRNLEMSTEAAIKYLRYLKDFHHGDWFLAMASYNAGEERVRKLIKEQKVTDFWKMHGPRETMRYVALPIALRRMAPGIVSQLITLFKDTSLASVVSVEELLRRGRLLYDNPAYGNALAVLTVVALMYFIPSYALSLVARRLERMPDASRSTS